MENKKVKYSIILPIYNGLEYLPSCINSIINQDYNDYELIIVDDYSTDGTREYLNTLKSDNIKVVYQEKNVGAIGNFSDAVAYASGEWVMFLGVDDGLQGYFFELADKLTAICEKEKLRVIASSRAHFFWEGAAKLHGDKAVLYTGRKEFSVLDSRKEIYLALFGAQAYFELPQMYCNSLFHHSILDEAKEKQGGCIFSTIPPDANLAAIALSLESKYLKSFMPLGWIGTSSSRTEYAGKDCDENGFISDGINYNLIAGKPAIGSLSLYLWNALLCTSSLRSDNDTCTFKSRKFKTLLFSAAYSELKKKNKLKNRIDLFSELVSYNNLSLNLIMLLSYPVGILSTILFFQRRVINKLKNIFMKSYQIKLNRHDNICILNESHKINEHVSVFLDCDKK
ncbi:glycosyltransferase family 2 protein [Aliivibrio fischeri]|uniref:glycosyltransferase family 2 protein n=1 Tax=Aliivibrio fischeri TaxID=668 RepID=UPI0007C4F3A6|nr:glycosyltransferase family 2 protein [Aliivibrio fischeri]